MSDSEEMTELTEITEDMVELTEEPKTTPETAAPAPAPEPAPAPAPRPAPKPAVRPGFKPVAKPAAKPTTQPAAKPAAKPAAADPAPAPAPAPEKKKVGGCVSGFFGLVSGIQSLATLLTCGLLAYIAYYGTTIDQPIVKYIVGLITQMTMKFGEYALWMSVGVAALPWLLAVLLRRFRLPFFSTLFLLLAVGGICFNKYYWADYCAKKTGTEKTLAAVEAITTLPANVSMENIKDVVNKTTDAVSEVNPELGKAIDQGIEQSTKAVEAVESTAEALAAAAPTIDAATTAIEEGSKDAQAALETLDATMEQTTKPTAKKTVKKTTKKGSKATPKKTKKVKKVKKATKKPAAAPAPAPDAAPAPAPAAEDAALDELLSDVL